jgi:hypothetical protein
MEKRYEVWRNMPYSGWGATWTREWTTRWRWLARLYAWVHTKAGWFTYEVRAAGE